MKIMTSNFFESRVEPHSCDYVYILDMFNYRQNPPFISVDNQQYKNSIDVINTHEFENPKNYTTEHGEGSITLGMWRIEYKKQQ